MTLVQSLAKSIQRNHKIEGMAAFRVYCNVTLSWDTSIHLQWTDVPVSPEGSMLGRTLAYQFRQHTIAVNHSVWTTVEELSSPDSAGQ
ncbi:hypothetical protein U27_05497 [Candidatus Vecturithrix granuli]|uniref:Uncharacterized protein n=1 Tax=Vecturithrix granuli TaxID=1499967 RepID=A0A081C1R8_VECG1|nr:hypothetical protein U27_05497 [Candidatus Vecturithrix granuli]